MCVYECVCMNVCVCTYVNVCVCMYVCDSVSSFITSPHFHLGTVDDLAIYLLFLLFSGCPANSNLDTKVNILKLINSVTSSQTYKKHEGGQTPLRLCVPGWKHPLCEGV